MRLKQSLLLAMLYAAPFATGVAATPDDVARLGRELTPVGAEAASSADGAIPAWEGGLTISVAGPSTGSPRADPFPDERPILSITAKNADQHAGRLTDGAMALLKKYPDSYRIDVYPSHRTAAAPPQVYEAIRRNAVSARLVAGPTGLAPVGAYGGIPFPMPKSGAEAIWNHLLRWRGESIQNRTANYRGTGDGTRDLVDGGTMTSQNPYYFANRNPEQFNGEYSMLRIESEAPPQRRGVLFVERDNFDGDKNDAWVYVPGQRRARKLPTACCDLPLGSAAGVITFDEPDVYHGRIDRFEWTLIGKAERYIPYNNNRSLKASVDEFLGPNHLNPDHVRWELHRVWIVEAKLAPGQRHAMTRSRYYLDEDTWNAVLGDRWDAAGTLARTLWSLPIAMPDIPAVAAITSGGHDLAKGTWIAMGVMNGKPDPYKIVPRIPDAHFTADAMAGEGVR